MIDCGIDESGFANSKGETVVVSAYFAATPHMAKFNKDWQADLDKLEIPFFHAKELWKPKSKLFRGISMSKRNALLSRLVGHIDKRIDIGLSAHIDVNQYRLETSDRFRSQYGSPYTFAIRQILMHLCVLLRNNKRNHEPINIVIEAGHRNEQQALDLLAEFDANRDRPLNIAYRGSAPKLHNPPLQAADLLAFATVENLQFGTSRIKNKLAATKHTKHFEVDCHGPLTKLMTDAVKKIHDRRKSEWERSRLVTPKPV